MDDHHDGVALGPVQRAVFRRGGRGASSSPNVTGPEPEVRRLPSALLIVSNGFLTLVALAAVRICSGEPAARPLAISIGLYRSVLSVRGGRRRLERGRCGLSPPFTRGRVLRVSASRSPARSGRAARPGGGLVRPGVRPRAARRALKGRRTGNGPPNRPEARGQGPRPRAGRRLDLSVAAVQPSPNPFARAVARTTSRVPRSPSSGDHETRASEGEPRAKARGRWRTRV
jgi:hypothetical protein